MKKYLLIILLPHIFLLGCKRLAEFTRFDLKYDESIVIPATLGVNLPFNMFTPKIESDSESEFAVNDTRKDLIEEINLTTLELTITSPSNGDFSFLESIIIFLEADSLPEIEIASREDIPNDTGNFLEMNTSDMDLQDYIKKDNFRLRVNTVTKKMIGSDHHIAIHAVFFVDAKVLGL
ncbi:MAG: hypothetical protein WD577_06395 [Bacteroidales bacterium]